MTLTSENTAIFACDNLLPYLEAAQASQGTSFPIFTIDRSLHVDPANMRDAMRAAIDAIPAQYETILVGMGFCGGVWDQVVAPRTMVIPRNDDCISILLSTDDQYVACRKEPWHIYVYEQDPGEFSLDRMMNEVGNDPQFAGMAADQLFHMFFDNYRDVTIIDTGLNDCYSEDYVVRAQAFADSLNATLDYAFGGLGLLEKLVSGAWMGADCAGQFLVAEPGTLVRHALFFD